MGKEKLIQLHEHQIDNAKRMYNGGEISFECYMENKAIHEKGIELLEEEYIKIINARIKPFMEQTKIGCVLAQQGESK